MRRPWPALGRSGSKRKTWWTVQTVTLLMQFSCRHVTFSVWDANNLSAVFSDALKVRFFVYDNIIFTLWRIIHIKTNTSAHGRSWEAELRKYSRSVWVIRNVHYIPLIFPVLSYNIQFTPSHPATIHTHVGVGFVCVVSFNFSPQNSINWSYFLCLPQVLPISSLTWSPE